jgi:hypothetical protein
LSQVTLMAVGRCWKELLGLLLRGLVQPKLLKTLFCEFFLKCEIVYLLGERAGYSPAYLSLSWKASAASLKLWCRHTSMPGSRALLSLTIVPAMPGRCVVGFSPCTSGFYGVWSTTYWVVLLPFLGNILRASVFITPFFYSGTFAFFSAGLYPAGPIEFEC